MPISLLSTYCCFKWLCFDIIRLWK
jgi:hypothetical protein